MPTVRETSTRRMNTFTIQVPMGSQTALLRSLSRNMGWKTTVRRPKPEEEERPVKMSKEEYFEMLDDRIAKAEEDRRKGRLISMREDETTDQFIDRLLCMN